MSNHLAEFEFEHHGFFALHNYPCPICRQETAVFQCNEGYFKPCWTCQSAGWVVRRRLGSWTVREIWNKLFKGAHP